MSDDLQRGKLEVSPLISPLVLSLSPAVISLSLSCVFLCLVLVTITVPSLFSFLFKFMRLSGLLFLCSFPIAPVQYVREFLDNLVAVCFCSDTHGPKWSIGGPAGRSSHESMKREVLVRIYLILYMFLSLSL